MEKQFYVLKPSLKQMAFIKISIIFSNHRDIFPLTRESYPVWRDVSMEYLHVQKLAIKMKEKLPRLLLPDSLKEGLVYIMTGIASEIVSWQMMNRFLASDSINHVDKLCWTSHGTVDYRETAKRLIRQKRVDVVSSYLLACRNCLEEDIRTIWSKLSDDRKKSFRIENNPFCERVNIVTFWTHFLDGDIDTLKRRFNLSDDESECRLFQRLFEFAALDGDKIVVEYCLQKLKREERETALLKAAEDLGHNYFPPTHDVSAVLIYLLSEMREELQIEVFKKYPCHNLSLLLFWPWTHLFIKIAGLIWSFLPTDDTFCALIVYAFGREKLRPFNKKKMLAEFFLQIPSQLRIDLLSTDLEKSPWLRHAFTAMDTECVKIFLSYVPNALKEKLITNCKMLELFRKIIEKKNWLFLELLVEGLTFSNETKTRFKECFLKFIAKRQNRGISKYLDLEKFCQVIGNANVCVSNKRYIEESESEEERTLTKKIAKGNDG